MPARSLPASDPLSPLLLQAFFRIHHTPAIPAHRPFCWETDRFGFANETLWNYVDGEVRPQAEREPATHQRYTRHCFVMVRAALQFWKFARFDSTTAPLPDDELARRIRRVCRRPVWLPQLPVEKRVTFPGFANLLEISTAKAGIFQRHIGKWWPIYFRPGNFPICLPVSPAAKARLNDQVSRDLDAGYPTLLWLYNFPSLSVNHTVLVYHATRESDLIRYQVYDPNYAVASKELQFHPATKLFTFESTFYFKGGSVTPRAIYRGFFE
jgi:hypothetical protein